jgi:hypothetical protein
VEDFNRPTRGIRVPNPAPYAVAGSDDVALAPLPGVTPIPNEPPPELDYRERLAARLRAAFVRERRRWVVRRTGKPSMFGSGPIPAWDGGIDYNGVRHTAVWPKVADQLIDARCADPERFILAQFSGLANLRASDMLGGKAMERYKQVMDKLPDIVLGSFQADMGAFRLGVHRTSRWFPDMTPRDVNEYVLGSHYFTLSPLFRYCCAAEEGFADLVDVYQYAALDQFMSSPTDYRRLWGNKLPQALRDHADSLIAQ